MISRLKKTEDGKDQWYAIKTMAKKQILKKSNNHGLEMLFNERNLLADLKSDFLINMHHCFQDDDSCYIVMDLMLGGDLRFHMVRCAPASGHPHGRAIDHTFATASQALSNSTHHQHLLFTHRSNSHSPRLIRLGEISSTRPTRAFTSRSVRSRCVRATATGSSTAT